MLRTVIGLIRQILPEDGEIKFINRFQYRALKPTWPVAFSLLFLGFAFLVPDQGRAIIKYTIDKARFDVPTAALIGFFILHGAVMMYSAFMLSAVTRRSQMDTETDFYASAKRDPVDSSISLRLRYSYWCGVFLPLLFMTMGFWFQFGTASAWFWSVVAIGLGIGFCFDRLALVAHDWIARKRSAYNLLRTKPGLRQKAGYTWFSLLHFCAAPEHRLAQSAIVTLISVLSILTVLASGNEDIRYPAGAWMFFVCFMLLHIVYRCLKDRIVRLHQGHTARYIIIDPKAERFFTFVRVFLIVFIPMVFWFPMVVEFLGPLGVGLFGTLWATLFFSGLVESSAKYDRSDRGVLPDSEKDRFFLKRWAQEFRSMRHAYSLKSWFFLFLIALLFIELLISTLEVLLFEVRFTADMAIFLILLGVIIFRKKIWKDRDEFRSAINRLPSASALAPILLLGLGEAHHIHRVEIDAQTSEFAVQDIDAHARQWMAARTASDGQSIPAIIILAEGGGIRAGAHAGFYLSHLDTALSEYCSRDVASPELCTNSLNTRLLDHVFSINGVSGGAVGSAVYLAGVKEEIARDLTPEQRHFVIKETLRADHLAPLFAGLFGSDVLTTVFPAQLTDRVYGLFDRGETDAFREDSGRGVYDRADFFEDRIATVFDDALVTAQSAPYGRLTSGTQVALPSCVPASSQAGQRTLDQTLEHVARCSVKAPASPGPMVFFSTFYETGGYQMATSNVDVLSGLSEQDRTACGSVPIVQQLIDRVEPETGKSHSPCPRRTKTLPISTAAHLSARFPVSNPTGVIETRYDRGRWKRHYFVDGGYMDNSGALTAIQSVEALRRAAPEGVAVNVIVLHLYALGIPSEADFTKQSGQRATKQGEFSSIPSAVLKARGAASRAPIRLLCNSLLNYSDGALTSDTCDTIFERREVTTAQGDLFTRKKYCQTIERAKAGSDPRYPVDPQRSEAIRLNNRDIISGDKNPIQAASWIPVPLEVAKSDRQDNAITALLGWSLLNETTENMDEVMEGTADITLAEIARSIVGTTGGIAENWLDQEELQVCNDVAEK
ncbi:MAG: hypothetical protein AAGL99_11780 [Pseudomonadota bacterium]